MDAKLTPLNPDSTKPFKLSGTFLLSVLAIVLTTSTIIWDKLSDRLTFSLNSVTLIFILSTTLSALAGLVVIPQLKALKMGQYIREDGPQTHLKKAGTPTMGGIFVVPVGLMVALFATNFATPVIAVSAITLAYGLIGWIDDWQILRYRNNKGLSPKAKLILQISFAIAFCIWLGLTHPDITNVALPYGIAVSTGLLFWPLAVFVLVAESNATNITDGVDGLAGGTGAIALFGLGVIIGNSSPELMMFCIALSGSYLGFVIHNRNPAKVFMGDTGSLALGGALAGVGLLSNTLLALLILSGIFFVESISVLAQVSYYKATKGPDGKGKRLFKMAPIHHHLELSGWTETKVVGTFYLINFVLALVCLSIFRLV